MRAVIVVVSTYNLSRATDCVVVVCDSVMSCFCFWAHRVVKEEVELEFCDFHPCIL